MVTERAFCLADAVAALAVESEWVLPKDGPVRSAYRVVLKFADGLPGLYAYDIFGYEIAYYLEERDQLTGDVFCGDCATALIRADDDTRLYPAYQINGEVGDAESVYCDDCHAIIYAGEEFD